MNDKQKELIIIDINESLVKELDEVRRIFYDKLEGKKKDYFLYMAKDDQATLMKGGLDAEEEKLMWDNASTLALKIINKGFGYTERVKRIGKIGRVSLTLALIAGLSGIVTSTYVKNHKIQSLIKVGSKSLEQPVLAINAVQNELVKPDALMTPADFLLSMNSCSPMGDISDSFYQSSGKPFCKTIGGKTWIGGYVRITNSYGEQAQPVLLMVEGGKVTDVEFKDGEKNPFQGVDAVPIAKVEKEIQAISNNKNKGEAHE